MKRKTGVEIIASLLIILFVYAAITKLFDYNTFRLQLGKSPFITSYAGILAWALPLGELVLVLLLVMPATRLIGLYVSLFTMTLFTAYIFMMLRFSYYVPCSCGGILSTMSWSEHLLFNTCFVAISITGILLASAGKEQPTEQATEVTVFT